MTTRPPADLLAYVEAAAATLALPLDAEARAAVAAELAVVLAQARLVAEFPLPEDAEPAATFRP